MTATEFSNPGATRFKLELVAALASVVVYTCANGFMTAGLGVAGRQLGLDDVAVGWVLGFGALAGVIAAPGWGYASEQWSRRKLMLWATPMVALGPATMALVTGQFIALPAIVSGVTLAIARLIQAVFGAALIPLAQGYVADVTRPSQRVRGMGGLSAAISFGTLSGSALLWLTGRLGIVSGFATISVFGILAYVFVLAYFPGCRTRRTLPPEETTVPVAKIWPYLAITLVGFTCYTTVPPIFALRLMDRFGMDGGTAAAQTGLVLTVGVAAVCIAQVLIAVRGGNKPLLLLRAGSAGIFVGLSMLLYANDVFTMCLSMAVIGFAVGFLAPAVLGAISLVCGRGAQGKIAGINMAFRGLGSAIGPVLGTTLYQAGHNTPIWGSIMLVAAVFLLTLAPHRIRAQAP